VGGADKAFLTGIDNTRTPYLADQCYAGKKRGRRFMTPPEKSKNKGRPYPLRRVLLVMIIGVAFMFWMPFVIVTDDDFSTYFHWLNYVVYWGAAMVWLLPLVRWLKRHTYLPRLHRLRTILLLVVVWLFLIGGDWFITKRGLLPPIHSTDLSCGNSSPAENLTVYYCDIPYYPSNYGTLDYKPVCLRGRYRATECFFAASLVVAEGVKHFPIARTTSIYTNIFFRADLYYEEVVGDG
jgi:hypothetical protein